MSTTLHGAALGAATELIECGTCGINFVVPAAFVTMRKMDHQTWYCPLGHQRYWPEGKSRETQLKEQLETERRNTAFWREQEAAARRREAAAKAQTTKLRNRAKAGVCPCCNRTFVQLARHIATKHPDYDASGVSS